MSSELRQLGKYELLSRLAQGGMGEVWKARDTELGRLVAIKTLRAELQNNPDFVERFEREPQLIASLRHPNIVKIHDFQVMTIPEEDEILTYMVMDFVEGQTLADYIRSTSRKGKFPPAADVVYIFAAISRALDYAHQQGMIHRDIKPANILLDQRTSTAKAMGEPILTDFGIARSEAFSTRTMTGALLGTPLYISPEQAKGQSGDKRSDLYSLGVILYEMTTGVTPFRGDTTIAILMQHIHDMPTPPALINPNIPPALSMVILKSIAKDPADRYQSATEMTIELAKALNVPVPKNLLSTRSHAYTPLSASPLTPSTGLNTGTATPHQSTMMPPYPMSAPYNTPQMPQIQIQEVPATPTNTPPQPQPTLLIPDSVKTSKQQPFWRSKKGIIAGISLGLVLLLLVGIGAAAMTLMTTHKTTPPATVISGQLRFSNSGHAPASIYDQVQLDVHNVPNPPEGHVYYAWIEIPTMEGHSPQHWPLTVTNNSITSSYTTPDHTSLLPPQAIFLITSESNAQQPIVPFTDPTARLYYATLNQQSSTFTVTPCPPINASNVCLG